MIDDRICPECGGEAPEDGAGCGKCAAFAGRRSGLMPAARNLAARVAAVPVPDDLEAALMAEFDRVQRSRRLSQRRRWLAGALAASLMAGGLVLLRPGRPKAPVGGTPQAGVAANASDPEPFLPIPYTQPLSPYDRVLVVQSFVPVEALIAAGFRVHTSDPGASVRADVMVSQDGRPRAIRPVSTVSFSVR